VEVEKSLLKFYLLDIPFKIFITTDSFFLLAFANISIKYSSPFFAS